MICPHCKSIARVILDGWCELCHPEKDKNKEYFSKGAAGIVNTKCELKELKELKEEAYFNMITNRLNEKTYGN